MGALRRVGTGRGVGRGTPEAGPAQANALRSAEECLALATFSEQGLIDPLSSAYEAKGTVEQATDAADAPGL